LKPTKLSSEQSKHFIETACKLGVDETEAGDEKAFGRAELKKLKKKWSSENQK
jgi:hypothetical protein